MCGGRGYQGARVTGGRKPSRGGRLGEGTGRVLVGYWWDKVVYCRVSTVDIANEALMGALVFMPLRGSLTRTHPSWKMVK